MPARPRALVLVLSFSAAFLSDGFGANLNHVLADRFAPANSDIEALLDHAGDSIASFADELVVYDWRHFLSTNLSDVVRRYPGSPIACFDEIRLSLLDGVVCRDCHSLQRNRLPEQSQRIADLMPLLLEHRLRGRRSI